MSDTLNTVDTLNTIDTLNTNGYSSDTVDTDRYTQYRLKNRGNILKLQGTSRYIRKSCIGKGVSLYIK